MACGDQLPILVGLDGSSVGTRCPTEGWLKEMNSPILVGLDVGHRNALPWGGE